MRLQRFIVLLAASWAFTAGGPAAEAQESKCTAAVLKEAAPKELAAEVRQTLADAGYRVSGPDGKPVCDVWFRVEVPLIDEFQEQVDLVYPIQPGTLVGVVRFAGDGSDYRGQAVKPGVYTLRYAHQPQDGNHIGTAVYRDFVMLAPASEDKSAASIEQDDVAKLSTKVSRTTHPAIMSLLPPQKDRGKLPLMIHVVEGSLELDALVAKTLGKQAGKTRDLQIELVTVGSAE